MTRYGTTNGLENASARPGLFSDGDSTPVGIIHENDTWLTDLFAGLEARGVPFTPIRVDDAAVSLDEPPPFPLVINRVSPSSYLRGHGPAIPYAAALLRVLRAYGRRVINGPDSFSYETSKVAQHLLFQRLGVSTPRTMLFNNRTESLRLASAFPFPAIVKPDCGGSGALVRRVADRDALVALLADEPGLFGPDHLLLLQEEVDSVDGIVVRTEFVDGELIYAMRVRSINTFNLCPADSCERHAADPGSTETPEVMFDAYPDIPAEAIAQAREIVRGAGLDVGGVEFIVDREGTHQFIDVNATSVYRDDVCRVLGIDAVGKLVDFVQREYHKELRKPVARWSYPGTRTAG